MVLEALAAIGLAGNVVQFVSFSMQLFSTASSIQRSCVGSVQGHQDVETITQKLQQCCERIASAHSSEDQQLELQHHQSLVKLAGECEAAAIELISAIQQLKAKKPNSKWSSFMAALATIWQQSQINDMEKRLDSYRQQLNLELALLLR